jgi:lipopolysaccharide/colanic/teichoic acid biosynthesis glycosyltransferase
VKRAFDVCIASAGLLLLLPLFLFVACAVLLDDGAPVFFSQERIGRFGRPFRIWKFRSMRVETEARGPSITAAGDPRITRIGRILRRWKLDELPQLWNVIRGHMSFVGPRPEVPRYVSCYSEEQRAVLQLQPGITDLATLEFRDEESLLASVADPEAFYVAECVPRKIALNLEYARRANIVADALIIIRTVLPPVDRFFRLL